jgi:FkbM family methyltransferase
MALGAGLLFAASFHPAVEWRLEVLRMALSGRLSILSAGDLLERMSLGQQERSAAHWVTGSATVLHANGEEPCPVLFETRIGQFQGNLIDESEVQWFVDKYTGLHLGQTSSGLMPVVEPGDVVIEAGAWLGVFARTALRYGAAKVVAIEPIANTAECLRRNLADDIAAGKVVVIEAAAWSEPGSVRMKQEGPNNSTGGSEGWNVSAEGDLEVPATTIDAVVRDLGLERVDLIEMDIEGSERHALQGARETIQRFAPEIVACIHHLPDDSEAVPAVVRSIREDYQYRQDGGHVRFTH